MEELREIIERKILIYSNLYYMARELNQEDNEKYYAECVGKLNEMIKIL